MYGSPHEDGKQEFLDELDDVMSSWQGPIMIGGDFNFVRFVSDKSNKQLDHRWADKFNDWIDKWGLLELNVTNRAFTWTNKQDNPIMAKIDRVFIST